MNTDKDVQPKSSGKKTPKSALSRRGLLRKAGWAAPVVVAVSIPMNAYSQVSHKRNCALSQGYYKNHDDWPVDSLVIGGNTYTKEQLMAILTLPPKGGNATLQLLHQLIAAKLNAAAGVDPSAVQDIITAADACLSSYGLLGPNSIPKPKKEHEQDFRKWAEVLEKYNTGKLFPYCPTGG